MQKLLIDVLLANNDWDEIVNIIHGLSPPDIAYLLATMVKYGNDRAVVIDFFYHLKEKKVDLPLGLLFACHDVGDWFASLSCDDLTVLISLQEMKQLALRVTCCDAAACSVLLKLADPRVIMMIAEEWCKADNPSDDYTLYFLSKLTRVFDNSAAGSLVQLLTCPEESHSDITTFVRSVAARSLGNIGGELAVEALVTTMVKEIEILRETVQEDHWNAAIVREAELEIIKSIAIALVTLSVTVSELIPLKPLLLAVTSGNYPCEFRDISWKLLQTIDSS
ncbi:MAG: hypothetical protein ACFFD4_25815 [Candidatus Odinarchaeota archaeon]